MKVSAYIERRNVSDPAAVSANIVRHMYTRSRVGRVVIVIDRPRIMLSVLRKQWAKLTRDVHRYRASTLDASKISILSDEMLRMHQLIFSCEFNQPNTDVLIMSPEDWPDVPDFCNTVYICSDLIKNNKGCECPVVDYRPLSYCDSVLAMR